MTRWREQHAAVPMDAARLSLLELGLASHHAGMLPLEKALVESLFQVRAARRSGECGGE